MKPTLDIRNWDVIESPAGDIVVIVPPIPRPRLLVTGMGDALIGTDGARMRLVQSEYLRNVLANARSIVIAECDECIVRETLVGHHGVETAHKEEMDDGRRAA